MRGEQSPERSSTGSAPAPNPYRRAVLVIMHRSQRRHCGEVRRASAYCWRHRRAGATHPTLPLKDGPVGPGPSLRGLWYRNGVGQTGAAGTPEEWLDPTRLNQDSVPKRYHRGPGPIRATNSC